MNEKGDSSPNFEKFREKDLKPLMENGEFKKVSENCWNETPAENKLQFYYEIEQLSKKY